MFKHLVVKSCAVMLLLGVQLGHVQAATPSHTKAAEELLSVMQADKNYNQAVEQLVDMQMRQNPAMTQFRDVMLEFFNKYMSFSSLKAEMAGLYADAFTEDELKSITAFYRTAHGQKMLDKAPELLRSGAEVGARRVQENMGELQNMIRARMQEQGQLEAN